LLSKIKKANFFNEIKDQVTVSVSYELTKKYSFDDNYGTSHPDCYGGFRYCAVDPDGIDGLATGKEILDEEIRQMCIFRTNQGAWWEYIE